MVIYCNQSTGELYKVHCPRLNFMVGHYESEQLDDENTVSTTCLRNFHYVSGDYVRSCLSNGSWTGKELVCEVDYFMERFKLSSCIVFTTFLMSLIFFGVDFWLFAKRRHRVRLEAQRRRYTLLQTPDGVVVDVSELKDLSRRVRHGIQPRTHLQIPLINSSFLHSGHRHISASKQGKLTMQEEIMFLAMAHDDDKKNFRLPPEFEDWWMQAHHLVRMFVNQPALKVCNSRQQRADKEEFFGVNNKAAGRKRRIVKPKKLTIKKRKRGILPVMHFEVTPDPSNEIIHA